MRLNESRQECTLGTQHCVGQEERCQPQAKYHVFRESSVVRATVGSGGDYSGELVRILRACLCKLAFLL